MTAKPWPGSGARYDDVGSVTSGGTSLPWVTVKVEPEPITTVTLYPLAGRLVPEPVTWDDALDIVLAQMRHLMIVRQSKYGKANVRQQGLYGIVTRAVADKVSRILKSLNGRVVGGQVELDAIEDAEDETFEDGCLDAANYLGPIALMVKRGWWELPRKNPEDER